MKKRILTYWLLLLTFPFLGYAMEGDGSSQAPFVIGSLDDFLQFRDTVNNGYSTACALLESDIDLSTVCYGDEETEEYHHWLPIGEGNSGQKYEGCFDGKGHIIQNPYVNSSTENFRGIFGFTHKATIRNIGVENAYIHGGYYVGGLIGKGDSTLIENCYTRGDIYGYFVSGIIGNASNCTLRNCYSTCTTQGNYHSALIGYATQTTAENCLFDSQIVKNGVGFGDAATIALKTEQFQNGTASQKLNEYVQNKGDNSLVHWEQDAQSLPTFAKNENGLNPILQGNGIQLYVQAHHIHVLTKQEESLTIYDRQGQIRMRCISNGNQDLGYFPTGIYFINGKKTIVKD
ncbi:MAG: hypothetical protein J6Y37_15785 [Paludibacteraceae bacterium]|nr:hypothetical protein [Paludibacteraceae bacterium]